MTQLLSAIRKGDVRAADQLVPMVYAELRKIAKWQMAAEPEGQTLQATALVHEAYLRLVEGKDEKNWENRRHFFGAAVRAMRRILVERARQKAGPKKGGGRHRVPLEAGAITMDSDPLDLLALDEAMTALEREEPRVNEIVMLRFFAGLSVDETARTLDISPSTVDREWSFGRAWLFNHIQGKGPHNK
ncbi:MAG: sigma-70 family RNA polymerase sigma factor [Planctomycetota bacterium]